MSVVHASLHVPVTFCHSLGNLGVPHKPGGGGGATQSMDVGDNCETSRPLFCDFTASKTGICKTITPIFANFPKQLPTRK